MGLSEKKQQSTSSEQVANQYGFQAAPDTPDIIAARNTKAGIDPSIGYRLGEKERQLQDSFASPTGGYVTPQIKDAIMRSGQRDLMQQASQATREGQFDVNRLNQTKNLALADMTKPILVQTGRTSSGTGTVKQNNSPWATIAGIGAQAAPMSL